MVVYLGYIRIAFLDLSKSMGIKDSYLQFKLLKWGGDLNFEKKEQGTVSLQFIFKYHMLKF